MSSNVSSILHLSWWSNQPPSTTKTHCPGSNDFMSVICFWIAFAGSDLTPFRINESLNNAGGTGDRTTYSQRIVLYHCRIHSVTFMHLMNKTIGSIRTVLSLTLIPGSNASSVFTVSFLWILALSISKFVNSAWIAALIVSASSQLIPSEFDATNPVDQERKPVVISISNGLCFRYHFSIRTWCLWSVSILDFDKSACLRVFLYLRV